MTDEPKICAKCEHALIDHRIPSLWNLVPDAAMCALGEKREVDYVTGKQRTVQTIPCKDKNTDGTCSDYKKGEPRFLFPAPPKYPIGSFIREGTMPWCPICNSSQKRRWLIFPTGKCIHPECENYYGKEGNV